MAVIIKKENGKTVYNKLNVTEEERERAQELDQELAKIGPSIEEKWIKQRILKNNKRKIDIKIAYEIGKELAKIVDNKDLVLLNERKWVWKAIRGIYFKKSFIGQRQNRKDGFARDDLEYLYKISKYSFQFVKNISWAGWKRLFDSASIQQDERFGKWFQKKSENHGLIKKGFINRFTKILYSLIKNKDTSVLKEDEIFNIYEYAWSSAMSIDIKK